MLRQSVRNTADRPDVLAAHRGQSGLGFGVFSLRSLRLEIATHRARSSVDSPRALCRPLRWRPRLPTPDGLPGPSSAASRAPAQWLVPHGSRLPAPITRRKEAVLTLM